ncbi:uncharacterized protein LOC135486421 [Lineus longissimus]|uniref:uncharacterized protein LOC135486421 n=1 Tax=Lineus longissimus TaxID=88925 RepID=UPI002B4E2C20
MAAGRRTWVASVFSLGIFVLWLLGRRLNLHTSFKTNKRLFEKRILVAVPFQKAVQSKDKMKDTGVSIVYTKPHKFFDLSRTTYIKELSVPSPKATQQIVIPKPTTPNIAHLFTPHRTEPLPSRCVYKETPNLDLLRGHEPQVWQNVAKRTIMVFSAFLDSRKEIGGRVIRVLASGKQARFGHSGKVSCVLWLQQDSNIVGVPTDASYEVIYESRLHPSMYTAHFIMCKLRTVGASAESILGVSVVPDVCGIISNTLKVIKSKPYLAQNNTFSICLSPIYGNYDNTPAIIEHIEMHKILGVERITVYVLSVGPNVGSILQQYQKEGLVDLVKWRYPYSKVLCDYFAQREALNDCLYRNMGRTRYLAVVDLDEIITPRKTLVWDAMMTRLHKPERAAYLFQHAYFLNMQPKNSKPTMLTQTVFSRPSEVFPPGKIRCKSIYEMEKTVQVNIHFPDTLLAGVQEYIVPAEEAMLHHYRSEVMQIFHDGRKNFTYIKDTYMVNYANRIRKAFSDRINMFNIE